MDNYDNAFSDGLQQIFESQSEAIRAEFDKIRSQHNHSGTIGDKTENIVQKFLKEYLPQMYSFGKGEIIDHKGEKSKEVDITVCNPSHPFTHRKDGQGLFFIEAVDAVIESKSTLNENHLRATVKNCRSVRTLKPTSGGWRKLVSQMKMNRIRVTPYALFAFESDFTLNTIIEKLGKIEEEEGITAREHIDLIFILNRGLIVYNRQAGSFQPDQLRVQPDKESGYAVNKIGPDLLMFLLFLQDKMPDVMALNQFLPGYLNPGFHRGHPEEH